MIFTRHFGSLAARRTFTETPQVEAERKVDVLTHDAERDQAAEKRAA